MLNGHQVSQSAINAGASLFSAIGCATCHNASPGSTQVSNFVPALSKAPVNAFSDIEIHHMGGGLADNVSQGGAGGDQFRTAPLWGLGQRIFLLHDGRTTDLNAAIQAHQGNGSEATNVEENFDSLSHHPAAGDFGLPAFAVGLQGADQLLSLSSRAKRGIWVLWRGPAKPDSSSLRSSE